MRNAPRILTGLTCILTAVFISGLACGESDEAPASSRDEEEMQDGMPALVDLGSHTCVPCQMMEDELVLLDESTGDLLTVTFIDIYENPEAATRYGVRVIPTQLFLAPDGSELFRHEGFMSAEQMLDRWAALGYDLTVPAEMSDDS